jgi:hypothetical protein
MTVLKQWNGSDWAPVLVGSGEDWSPASAGTTTTVTSSDYFVVDQGGVAKRIATPKILTFVNVRHYGAAGNGVTDDTSAIQAAIDAAGAAGGGIVFFPAGTYLVNTSTVAGGTTFFLVIDSDNVVLAGEGDGSHITSTANPGGATRLVSFMGAAKSGTLATWADRRLSALSVYPMSGTVAEGSTSVTLATPANASNFVAGDLVYIRTGQTITGDTHQPVAEVNEVVTANAGTGVLTLARPTAHPYQQEYFVSGTTGPTSTSVTANAALFGVAKATGHVLVGCGVQNLKLSGTNITGMVNGWQLDRFHFFKTTIAALRATTDFGSACRVQVDDCHFSSSDGNANAWLLAPSTGCSDWDVDGSRFTTPSYGVIHIHEAVSRFRMRGCVISVLNVTSSLYPVSIRARVRNVSFTDVEVHAFGASSHLSMYVDDTCGGGQINGCVFTGENLTAVASINAAGWTERDNTINASQAGGTNAQIIFHQIPGSFEVQYLTAWVSTTVGLTPTLGTVPAHARIVSVSIEVTQAFNSDGTDLLSVGYSGSTAAYATATDVSTTGIKTVTLGTGVGYSATARDVIATYAAGGSAPSTGKALVSVAYQRVPRHL